MLLLVENKMQWEFGEFTILGEKSKKGFTLETFDAWYKYREVFASSFSLQYV